MNKIFIEAKKPQTSECCFLETILKNEFPDKIYNIICMDGVDNLFNQGILTLIRTFQDNGDKVIVILDADTIDKKWGFEARKSNTMEKMQENEIDFPFFLHFIMYLLIQLFRILLSYIIELGFVLNLQVECQEQS